MFIKPVIEANMEDYVLKESVTKEKDPRRWQETLQDFFRS